MEDGSGHVRSKEGREEEGVDMNASCRAPVGGDVLKGRNTAGHSLPIELQRATFTLHSRQTKRAWPFPALSYSS